MPAGGSQPVDPRGYVSGGGKGGGGGSGGGKGKAPPGGWDTVYGANEDLQQPYMNQYGTAADQRLDALQQIGVNESRTAGAQSAQIGMQSGINAQNTGQGYGGQASNLGQAYGAEAAGFGRGAAQALVNQGQGAQAYGVQQGNEIGNFGNAVYGSLSGLEAQQGPSAAQAQLQSGLNQSQAANLAMARSGRGFGGSANALAQAQAQNAAAGQEAANQSAMLAAQENAAWRQRQAANLGNAANIGINARVQGAQLGQQGIQQNLGATGQAAQYGLQGITAGGQLATDAVLGGGGLALSGTTQGGQLALQGSQQQLQGIGQAGALGLSAEQQRAANEQYGFGLAESHTARDLQIAGMQAGFNLQNAAMANQTVGAAAGAAGGLLAMSDIRNKEQIEADGSPRSNMSYSDRAGEIGREAASQARMENLAANEEAEAKKEKRNQQFGQIASGFQGAMSGGLGSAVNPITGQPWFLSDERMKNYSSDKRAKAGADGGGSAALEAFENAPGYSYKYKNPDAPGAAPGKHFGPMAQDLERTEAGRTVVETGPDGKKMVNAPRLALLEASALSALNEKVDQVIAHVTKKSGKKGKKAA